MQIKLVDLNADSVDGRLTEDSLTIHNSCSENCNSADENEGNANRYSSPARW